MEKRPFYLKRLILAFVLATIIFSGGFLLSYVISYSKYQSISRMQENIRYELLNFDIESKLLGDSCYLFSSKISEELDYSGNIISILEERFGKTDSRVVDQKKYYTLLEVQHFLSMKDYKERCDENINLILFFYSNEKNFENEANKIGLIISSYKLNNNNKTKVYSFDYNLDISLINILKQEYNITQPNVIVINEEQKISGLKSIDELEEYVNKK